MINIDKIALDTIYELVTITFIGLSFLLGLIISLCITIIGKTRSIGRKIDALSRK